MIRWGIIGCGDVCEVKSGPGFQNVEGSQLVAVMRRDGKLAESFAKRHDVPRWYDDAEELIHDSEVNAVYVATPPGTHAEYALKCAAAGKPAYVEKPMARNYAECVAMVEAFRAAKLPLFVAYYRRALPRFLKIKQIIDEGQLGQVTGVSLRFSDAKHLNLDANELPWRVMAERAGGGLFLDLASHTLDLVDFLLGPLEDVSGVAANLASPHDVEDHVVMRFRTKCGALGTGAWNFAAGVREDVIEIDGTEGRVAVPTFGNDPIRLTRKGESTTFDIPNPINIQTPMIQVVVNAMLHGGSPPSTGESGARTSKVMDDALNSYYGGRQDAFWDRPYSWPGRRKN